MKTPNIFQRFLGGLIARSSGVPASWFAHAIVGQQTQSLFDPFNKSVWVQRAIKTISGPVASVELEFELPGTSAKTRAKKDGQAAALIELPELDAFLEQPSRGLSYFDFIEATIGWMKLQGEAFWIIDDTSLKPFPEVGSVKESPVIIARPDRMREVIMAGQISGWVFTDGSGIPRTLLPEQVIHITSWNPTNEWRGSGEFSSARVAAEGDWLAGKFMRNLMASNGDTGPFIISKDGSIEDPQREQILAELRAKKQAQASGEFRAMFLTGDINIEDPKIKGVDAAFIDARLANRHEIAIAFGVPPSMFDVQASYSIGSASDYFRLINDTCMPAGVKVCGALDRLILALTKKRVKSCLEWDEHPVMQAVRRERLAAADGLWAKGMPLKDVSEYLGLNLPRFEGDDTGFLPFSVAPVSTVSEPPADPATDPSFAENPPEDASVNAAITALRERVTSPISEITSALAARRELNADHGSASLKSREKNRKRWESLMQKRVPHIRAMESKVSKVIMDARATALRKLDAFASHFKAVKAPSDSEVLHLVEHIFNADEFGDILFKSLNPLIKKALSASSEEVLNEIGVTQPWSMAPTKVIQYLKDREVLIKTVSETAQDQLHTAVAAAMQEGLNVTQLADAVRETFNNLRKFEAKRIAMTETGAAYGEARHDTIKASGVEYKSWLSSHGPNVREAHIEAEARYEAQPIPINEPFVVDGEELMHPCDDGGSAGNVINCQCIEIAVAAPGGEEDDK